MKGMLNDGDHIIPYEKHQLFDSIFLQFQGILHLFQLPATDQIPVELRQQLRMNTPIKMKYCFMHHL